jgi:hypothetical protein
MTKTKGCEHWPPILSPPDTIRLEVRDGKAFSVCIIKRLMQRAKNLEPQIVGQESPFLPVCSMTRYSTPKVLNYKFANQKGNHPPPRVCHGGPEEASAAVQNEHWFWKYVFEFMFPHVFVGCQNDCSLPRHRTIMDPILRMAGFCEF